MKLTIEPTAEGLSIEGQSCRIWIGEDENGTPVKVLVRAVSPQTHEDDRLESFERTLLRLPPLRVGGID